MPSKNTIGPSIAEKLNALRARLDQVAKRPVQLIAVSKLHPAEAIREAYAAGQRDFGENYAQEALQKIEELKDLADVRWHFIGRLQSNKAKLLGRKFHAIHSVDRESIAQALARDPAPQNIFLQINPANEDSKGGVETLEGLQNLFTKIDRDYPALCVQGLMTMPPLDQPARPFFATTRAALVSLKQLAPGSRHTLDQLSMGTSADFVEAIQEGATAIRVGSEIFGPRTRENA